MDESAIMVKLFAKYTDESAVLLKMCAAGLESVVTSLKLSLLQRQQELKRAHAALDLFVQYTHDSFKITR